MQSETTISGFTIVRNAIRLNYPFEQAVRSVLPLVDEFIINCGDGDDETFDLCQKLVEEFPDTVKVFSTHWDESGQKGGFQLKYQTDLALQRCRGDWCFYIQADEAIHEQDFEIIKSAMERAKAAPEVDGILFDYLHFYINFDYHVRGRAWYRHEVRLFKNHRGISAYQDAQGFRREGGGRLRVVSSGARVFHYGHVRTLESFQEKKRRMSVWWGEKPNTEASQFEPKNHIGLVQFTESHPQVMAEFIAKNNPSFDPSSYRRVWDKNEVRSALDLFCERFLGTRFGEYRNYSVVE